jgi:hypothetical protein
MSESSGITTTLHDDFKPDASHPITVGELIVKLSALPFDASVLVCPWEGHTACSSVTGVEYDDHHVLLESVKP